ncbi:MAG TPA: cupredoxin domain-containing protein [Symbiobacteriaceae bacterium]|nr:cupredoxin domain-containing protein [Symbiobacteriaceae bacterium]
MKQIVTALALAALLAGCSGSRPRAQQPPVQMPAEYPAPVITQKEPLTVAQQVAGQTGVVTVRITDRGFEPAVLKAAADAPVKIHLKNESSGSHNLVVERFGIVSRPLAPGDENYIEFAATARGDWPMISDAPGRPEPAFAATLKVE